MRATLSLIKADVGSVGGHTQPTEWMLDAVREAANEPVISVPGTRDNRPVSSPPPREVLVRWLLANRAFVLSRRP